jgi:hypothetical protein
LFLQGQSNIACKHGYNTSGNTVFEVQQTFVCFSKKYFPTPKHQSFVPENPEKEI